MATGVPTSGKNASIPPITALIVKIASMYSTLTLISIQLKKLNMTTASVIPTLLALLIGSVLPLEVLAQNDLSSLERKLVQTSHDVDPAVVALFYSDMNSGNFGVLGTGFFINADGYFITAAHVLDKYKPNSAQMTAQIRQTNNSINGQWFDIVEKDEAHDLALCKLSISPKQYLEAMRKFPNQPAAKPFASLGISTDKPEAGRFVAIAGFPLGSWNPAIQLGTVAATETVNPTGGRVPAGQRELLQISVSGNKGNSGSPVIELRTRKVIGVVVQAVPSPLFTPNDAVLPIAQSSGVMLAVPASWVQELLKRHHVVSATILPTTSLR